MKVEIANGRIVLNGAQLSLPCPEIELANLLGEPSRAPLLAGNIFCVWDNLGIYARVGPFNLTTTAIGFGFNSYDAEFIPTSFFQGNLVIDCCAVNSTCSTDGIQLAGFTAYAGKDFWERNSGPASLQAIFEHDVLRCIEIEHFGE